MNFATFNELLLIVLSPTAVLTTEQAFFDKETASSQILIGERDRVAVTTTTGIIFVCQPRRTSRLVPSGAHAPLCAVVVVKARRADFCRAGLKENDGGGHI